MMRVAIPPRPDWQDLARGLGFRHHTYVDGPYWRDDAYYALTAAEVADELRPAMAEIWAMCLEVAELASRDEAILQSLRIPPAAWDALRQSWRRGDPSLLARLDFAYGDGGPPKLHECNGDTPGLLFESAVFQWIWLEDRLADATLPASCDQFNRLHEALVEAFAALPDGPIHVAASSCNIEDDVQARYLHDCAHQARRRTFLLPLDAVGADTAGRLFDADGRAIECLVKVYRWELLLREPFGPFVTQPSAPLMIEPLWKLVLSSKGLLVWLWRLFPRHPNLLPCWFEDDPRIDVGDRYVVKPLYSIKGANVRLVDPSLPRGGVATPGPYGQQGHVVQALHRIAHFPEAAEACHASLSGWLVGGKPEGIAILEGDGPIIHEDTSRFVPHVVLQ